MSNCYSFSLPPLMYLSFSGRCRFRHTIVTSAVGRRHHRRRLLKYSSDSTLTPTQQPTIFRLSDDTLQITLKPPLNSLQQLEGKLHQFLNYGREAFDDLRTVVTVDGNNGGVVISCRRSTVEFLIALLVSSLVVVTAFRGLFKLRENRGEVLVYKRDRSLGGREVVVGKRETNWSTSHKSTPLSGDNANYYQKKRKRKPLGRRRVEELPQWWPQVVNWGLHDTGNKEEYQTMANQLIRAIMDRKMSGEDISTNDIVQLRHICKTYGVRTFITTANARDSLYRVSINFVLDYCESMSNVSTSIQINGEDVREFIAGLADNIGLESAYAARMVSAAVAARTRSRILQAWALEVQNKHSEALVELFKVCVIHRIFPPAENSPEMEMVARGLDKSLSVEQREYILNSFIDVCGKDIDQSLVEALGLGGARYEQGSGHA
ncbi:uncharacterized protein LOC105158762 [Sesamum indicum]|uniref:Uncharacterized protein LOC105158762 n=1 Tax=Sesamum indicum TaxID=4182 RepID=A0A6I9SUR2_SESIN|nr:uncharacterized protein LOC105158762 [Sesamum indicum]XP_011073917.1 uncharacterized protein LOC105158762 [Sesamum indicum]XP_020548491.1 uncharacterized protein LOC105158762 [Sesamum indicum]XP_020548492.1 uncharacterized protein LOC105158762 [Sesamum indicum]XP_020548493.1 uncharacterized protein LOC105158762 [Sesamum indicum]XP_020548494.1 uncharacterized protein LOC105158762 [Sesamum indicum]